MRQHLASDWKKSVLKGADSMKRESGIAMAILMLGLTPAASMAGPSLASGGSIVNYIHNGTNYTAHIFTEDGTFTPDMELEVEVLVVGGGGGGGSSQRFSNAGAGAGGAGGLVHTNLSVSGPVTITVGGGGAGGSGGNHPGDNGGNSVFDTIVALGGGGGPGGNANGNDGGSGSGKRNGTPGQALQPGSASGGFGHPGGAGSAEGGGSGGGGAGGPGIDTSSNDGTDGGLGMQLDISGSPAWYAAGGGGGARGSANIGFGGSNIGGNGANNSTDATPGATNTGSGGGGGNNSKPGADGGSGIVIVRYWQIDEGIYGLSATDITDTSADLQATLNAIESTFTVTAYWSENDNADTAAWIADGAKESASLGTFAADTLHSLTAEATGLAGDTTYYYTFHAEDTAESVDIWATTASFSTLPTATAPAVTDLGATDVGIFTATLRGELADGGHAQAYFVWGENAPDPADDINTWENVVNIGTVLQDEPFTTDLEDLGAPVTHYYRVYVENAVDVAWSDVASFTTLEPVTIFDQKVSTDWNIAGNWDNDVPIGTIDAVIASGKTAFVNGADTPSYSGNLTLQSDAYLDVHRDHAANYNALGDGTITFHSGSRWRIDRGAALTINNDIVFAGDTSIFHAGNANDNKVRTLNGVISGTGQLTYAMRRGNRLELSGAAANTWSGGIVANFSDSNFGNASRVEAQKNGAFGTGDVTVNDGISLEIGPGLTDAIDDNASVHLNGRGRHDRGKLVLNSSETIGMLYVDGYNYPAGTHGRVGSGADYEWAWITGNGVLTVGGDSDGATPPTVTFANDQGGGDVYPEQPVVYTVTFDKPHTPALTAGYLENATGTGMTIESVTALPEVGDMTVVSYEVVVKATEKGTLSLGIKASTSIQDLFGNPLVVPVADEDTLTVLRPSPIKCELGILKPWANGGINPATGEPWKIGDQYRLVFISSVSVDPNNSAADNISYWNNAVQAIANDAGLGSANWNIIGSTADVDARDNTSTNPDVDGTGHAIFALDGSSVIENNFVDLWNGNDPVNMGVQVLRDENGVVLADSPAVNWPLTGTNWNGTAHGTGFLKNATGTSGGNRIRQGGPQHGAGRGWIDASRAGANWFSNSPLSVYGMSEALTLKSAVDPDESTVTASLASVPADGVSTSTITVTLLTDDGTPVAERPVELANTAGPGMADIAPATPVTTDDDGKATFTVSSGTVGTEVFTATDIIDDIVITQTASVAFEIVLQTSMIPGYTPPPPPAPDAPQTSLAMTTAAEPPPPPEEQAVQETSEATNPVEEAVPGVIRVTEYYLSTGDFVGTATTVALEQDLADDYFILVRGSRAGNGLSMPDNDYARVAAVPGGRGGLADSGAADAIGLQRAAAAFDWEGVVTVVESTVPGSPAGFRLIDAVVTTLSGTSGSQICAPWGDASQVVPFGGYRGGGAELTGGAANRYQGTSVYVRLSASGNDTLDWQRDPGGETLVDATMTTFVVEWGTDWTVQHAAVAGSAGGDGADATDAYATADIGPVARANTWVWGTGIRANSGIGNCAESCLVTLGDGVNLNATESAVAVGSEYTDAYSFDVYALTHPELAVDHRFKPDGDLKGLDIPVAVDPAASGARFAWLYNGCNGTSSRFPRPRMWSRYTADDTITVSRGYDGAQFPAWVQGIDFSALAE